MKEIIDFKRLSSDNRLLITRKINELWILALKIEYLFKIKIIV